MKGVCEKTNKSQSEFREGVGVEFEAGGGKCANQITTNMDLGAFWVSL